MAKKKGHACKVAIGSNKVVGLGSFNIPGINWDKLDSTEMGDTIKSFLLGLGDGGEVTASGQWDPADTTGQVAIKNANRDGTAIADVRFYIDSTSYYTASTTNPATTVYVTKFDVKADLSGLLTFDMTLGLSGGYLIQV